MIDLAQPILGSKIVYKTDEFFAKANRIINPNKPVFIENKFVLQSNIPLKKSTNLKIHPCFAV